MMNKDISVEKEIVADLFVKEREYWLNKFSGELTWNHFPYDYQGKDTPGDTFDTVNFKIAGDALARLEKLVSGSNSKLHIVLTTALAVLLHKYSGSEDIIIGTPIDKQKTDADFINTVLVLRSRISNTMTFKELLLQMRQTIIEAIENQNYPLDALITQLNSNFDENGTSLFDVALLVENLHDREYLRGVNTGIIFSFLQGGNGVEGVVEYNSRLYENTTVKRLSDHFTRVLGTALSNVNAPLSDIHVLSGDEKKRLIYDFNNTAADYPWNKPVHELFEEQAGKTPNNTAAEFDDKRLSYGELNDKKNRLAGLLRMKGVTNGSIVGIMAARSLEVIAAILGVLKAGGAYLPLDTEYPENRKKYILEDSGTTLLLNDRTLPGHLNWNGEIIDINDWDMGVEESNVNGLETIRPGPSDLAYIIYTSGSTGKPKGVMIEHRGLVNYVWWAAGSYVKNRNYAPADFPLYTSISFDLTVTSIFAPLIIGGKIIVYGDEREVLIEKILKENKVGIVKLTPTHLKLIRNNNDGNHSNINCFIVGGEELETRLAKDIHNGFQGKVDIYNEYGPTEATVGCMIYRFNPTVDKRISVPIGVPSANARIYMLDKNLEPVPVGVTGEIYISGDGVARGYLNRPELTAERFTINPFEPGQRLYGSGDLGSFTTEGSIVFLGRKDNQVKIRGHRVELREIENKLTRHNEIKDALVTVKENENGDENLCAYVVLNRELDLSEIREYLSKELPDFMIPSYFVNLTKIPLNPNGKVDRGALPDPLGTGMKDNTPYMPPRNMSEKLITEVWEKVLGRKNISVNENFFMLGGDSIKSIQIISRINSAGYKLEMRDLFQYPVISDLALRVKKAEYIPDQAPVLGVIPLVPIQEWFFDKHRVDIHHFNQSVMLYSRDGFDEKAIKAVFTKIQEHHDVLRMTYKEEKGEIIQLNHGLDYPLSLLVFDFRNRENSVEILEAKANEIQASIDLEKGPLMKLGLFRLDDGDRLLIVIHHLLIDGVSWRILFEDIETLYQQYKKGEELDLPLKTDSFKVWAEKLSDYANSETFLKEKAYWTGVESSNVPIIKKDFDEKGNYRKDANVLSFTLGEKETDDLLTKVNDAFGTEINDILLTALGMGIKKAWGHDRVSVSLEGHGREEIMETVDINRTVGWFTSVYPLAIDISCEDDLGRQIKEVKEAIRKVPNKGIGHGILKYLTGEGHKKDIQFKLNPQIGFNYLGQFDADIKQMSFEIAKESAGYAMSREGERELDFDFSGMIANNRLRIYITYNKKHYKPETMDILLDNTRNELKNIIAFCCSKENKERTPSDFTYKGLSIDTIDRLIKEYPGIEDIYTLTPMQEGMLFHALYDQSSYSYFEQTSYRLHGELDISLVEKSLNELFKRHDILRTAFEHNDIERPVQLVLKDRTVDFYYEDISKKMERAEKENFVGEFKAKDKERGFDLRKGALMRVSIIEVDTLEYEFTWSFHHILMDGWCIGILNADFFEIYNSYLAKRPYRLPVIKPYRTYIQWLEEQDKEESARYWENYLDLYEEQTGVPKTKILTKEKNQTGYRNETLLIEFDMEKTAGLNKLAANHHVTLNILTQALWGILLGRYNGKEDAVFGAVVSGRPVELEGVESMVGLFINTIPVRIRFEQRMKFHELLQKVQEDFIAGEPHHYHPLAEIQSRSTLKQNLMDHLFIFENFPIAQQIEGSESKGNNSNKLALKLKNVEVFEQTHYDFNVELALSDRLYVAFKYNGNVYDKEFVERIANHFTLVVDQVIENEELEIKSLTLLAGEEKNQLLYDFNNTAVEFPKDRTIHELFEEQAARTPDRLALVGQINACGEMQLSYRQLNEESNRLAGYLLKELSIRPDTLVAILMERSEKMAKTILAAWKTGGAYIPLDTEDPMERIDAILQDSGAAAVITDNTETAENLCRSPKHDTRIICLEELTMKAGEDKHTNPNITIEMSDLAYVIYTSGSTGKPKGAMIEHLGMLNHIYAKIKDINLDTDSVIAQNASHCFDISVWQFFAALVIGGKTVIYNRDVVLDTGELINRINNDRITVLEMVPSHLSVLLDILDEKDECHPHLFESLKYFLTTGETVKPALVKRCFEWFPDIKIVNAYGPTEASDDITHYTMSEPPDTTTIPVGTPVPNFKIYIVDKELNICPIGIKGEIMASGIGIGRGYLNDLNKTADAFIKDPFQNEPGVRLYKTGDIGRYLEDGRIEFFGRKDYQVKIKGFRIEVGEIERQLTRYPDIKEVVVVCRNDEQGDNYLCAYIVSHHDIEVSELREYLSTYLPGYMIPAYFVNIERIPLNANGKIDRKSLPEPGIKAGEAYTAPMNSIEEKLAEIWSDILKIKKDKIGIDSNFFELGGHSLRATIMATKTHKALNVKLPLVEIFKTPTIRGLAEYLSGTIENKFISMEAVEKKEFYSLSSSQKRLYLIQKMDSGGTTYNMPEMYISGKEPDKKRLKKTFMKLIQLHESLRTSFDVVSGQPVQHVHDHVQFEIEYYAVSKVEVKDAAEEKEKIIKEFVRPFDLSMAPLIRIGLLKAAENEHILMVDMHHIISDGVSHSILVKDFIVLYGGTDRLAMRLHYKDFTYWQTNLINSGEMKKQEQYWLNEFAGAIPGLNLPMNYDRREAQGFEGDIIHFLISINETNALRDWSKKENATLFIILLAIYNVLLSKLGGQDDIIVGVGTAGRRHADLEKIIGMFVNTLALRNRPVEEKTFNSFLREVRDRTLQAFDNQDYLFEDLVEKVIKKRDLNRNPLFDTVFMYENIEDEAAETSDIEKFELPLRPYRHKNIMSKFDMLWSCMEVGEELQFSVTYRTKLFEKETIERFISHFKKIVAEVTDNSDIKIEDILTSLHLLRSQSYDDEMELDF